MYRILAFYFVHKNFRFHKKPGKPEFKPLSERLLALAQNEC